MLGMQFLDFFDFITNSIMMPISAILICILTTYVIGIKKIEKEVCLNNKTFKQKKIFAFMIKYLCPIFSIIILISSILNTFGIIHM